MHTPYDTDFYTWTQHQAALLREGVVGELDLEHLAEEIESLGISQRHQLAARLTVLLMHLLKWQYQPSRRQRGRSWQSTIVEQRSRLSRLLRDSPSLRGLVLATLVEEYPTARRRASLETGVALATFPDTCPWSVDQLLQDDFWPEA